MFRKLLLLSVLLAGVSGMALAEGGDTNIEQFEASQPHQAGMSNGIPVIVDNQNGEPVIQYRGQAGKGFGSGIPVIVDNQEGDPVIRYEQGNQNGSATAEARVGAPPAKFD